MRFFELKLSTVSAFIFTNIQNSAYSYLYIQHTFHKIPTSYRGDANHNKTTKYAYTKSRTQHNNWTQDRLLETVESFNSKDLMTLGRSMRTKFESINLPGESIIIFQRTFYMYVYILCSQCRKIVILVDCFNVNPTLKDRS